MKRKVLLGVVVALVATTLAVGPAAWAAPGQVGMEATSWWRVWVIQLGISINLDWGRQTPTVDHKGSSEGKGKVVPAGILDGGGTCTDPTITLQGCVTDPDG